MKSILLKNGRIWDGERFFRGDVFIGNGKISRISQNISEQADFIMDVNGNIVSAGLVDVHTHLRGVSSDSIGAQAEISCFPFGVTCAADAEGVNGNKQCMDCLMVKTKVFVNVPIEKNRARLDIARNKLMEYGERAVGLKVFFDEKINEVWSIEPLSDICEFASENNLKVMVHSTNSPVPMSDIVNTLKSGSIISHIFHGGKNNAEDDGFESLLTAREKGVITDLGFEGLIHTDFNILKEAIRQGVFPDTISTDLTKVSMYTLGGKYGLTMCMSIAGEMGMNEADVFRAVTSTPAKVLGMEDCCGHIKENEAANIAVLEETTEAGYNITDIFGNTINSEKGYQCILTVSDGEVVFRR